MKVFILVSALVMFSSACVPRDHVIKRAMEWVSDGIPYDANKYHNGYVQGSMGIVGYAWQFPQPGISSADLIPQGYCKKTVKNNMEQGDLIVCPGIHQLIFYQWTDCGQSEYVGIQLGDSGSVKAQFRYPYSNIQNCVTCKVTSACQSNQNLQIE